MARVATSPYPYRIHTWEAIAVISVSITPAYAHSLSRGKRGDSSAIAPSSFHPPRMTRA
jgi:hypothetical protein